MLSETHMLAHKNTHLHIQKTNKSVQVNDNEQSANHCPSDCILLYSPDKFIHDKNYCEWSLFENI